MAILRKDEGVTKMKDLENYYVMKRVSDGAYVSTIYQNSLSHQKSLHDAIMFPNKELALLMKEYLDEREETLYRVMNFRMVCEEVE